MTCFDGWWAVACVARIMSGVVPQRKASQEEPPPSVSTPGKCPKILGILADTLVP